MTTAQQLQLASSILSKAFSETYSTAVTPNPSLHTRANIKWSKILINSLPTGVSNSRGAYSPDKCQAALAFENPSYSPLIIAQAPNWVKPPSSFSHGLSSSLVVAFKDPNSTKARALLEAKHLFAFGTCATLRKWKQRPTPPTNLPYQMEDPIIITAPSQLPSTFSPGHVPAATRPFTRQAARQPKTLSNARVMHKL